MTPTRRWSGRSSRTRAFAACCGEGIFDEPAFLRAVQGAGFDAPYYGVEIISEAFRRQPLEVMARTSWETTMRQIELAGMDQPRTTP